MSKWYSTKGGNADVVLTSRITLARNIAGIPFPCRMTNELRKSICKRLYAAIQNSELAGEFDLTELDKLSDLKKISLAEKGLIAAQQAKQEQYSALLLSKDESVAVTVCGEEHISISASAAFQDFSSAYEKANKLDDIFISSMNIAFSEKLGFLTSNPMKLGTGMKASVLLHLPAINERGILPSLRNMLSKLGFSIKPIFGEGSFYELANEISLGISEKSAIENLNAITNQIVNQERAYREDLMNYDEFQDKIFRAMGTLKMARQLSSKEFYSLISLARLGIAMKIFDNNEKESYENIGEMMYSLGTATIMSDIDAHFSTEDTNRYRAQYVREKLG